MLIQHVLLQVVGNIDDPVYTKSVGIPRHVPRHDTKSVGIYPVDHPRQPVMNISSIAMLGWFTNGSNVGNGDDGLMWVVHKQILYKLTCQRVISQL